jgi:hypothetical protein
LAVCESRSSSETATAAVFAELRGDANVRLSFITAYREDQCSIL